MDVGGRLGECGAGIAREGWWFGVMCMVEGTYALTYAVGCGSVVCRESCVVWDVVESCGRLL